MEASPPTDQAARQDAYDLDDRDVVTPTSLPGTLKQIAEICGVDVAISLARSVGGGRIYVPLPDNVSERTKLAKVIGVDAAIAISRHFGNGDIAVPNARAFLNWLDARSLRRQGYNAFQISRRLNLATRRVHHLVAGIRKSASAPDIHEPLACPTCGREIERRCQSAESRTDQVFDGESH